MLKLILGLGNPGAKYSQTRHNLGFRALATLQKNLNFPPFTFQKKFQAELSNGELPSSSATLIMARPQTFMNLSGQTARAFLNFYKLTPENLLVIYDDLDLPFGTIRLRAQGRAGGHQGLQDIITALNSTEFCRLRLGIRNEFTEKTPAADFVLKDFSQSEQKQIPQLLQTTSQAVLDLLTHGFEFTANKFNAKLT